jgi:hypothetical protein
MPRLTTTKEFVVLKMTDHEWGIAATTKTRHGVTIVERPVKLADGDALDAITVCKALNAMLEDK